MPAGKIKITFKRKGKPPLTFVREWAGQWLDDVLLCMICDEAMFDWVPPVVLSRNGTKKTIENAWLSHVPMKNGDRLIVAIAEA